jgi:hypothetical protein
MSKELRFKRTPGGAYVLNDWTIDKTEGEFRAPGYHWCAQHPDKGETYHSTLRDAKDEVRRIETKHQLN